LEGDSEAHHGNKKSNDQPSDRRRAGSVHLPGIDHVPIDLKEGLQKPTRLVVHERTANLA
jgi:hypothetical protein